MNFYSFPSKLRLFNAAVIPMTTLLLSPALSAATNCATQGDIPPTECQALLDLYNNTTGTGWTDSATNNWNVTTTPCSWTGVTCGGGHVTQIDRNSQNLTGTLPLSLNVLTGLTDLRLYTNSLTGTLPSLPTGLTIIDLHVNSLSGSIPSLPTGLTAIDLSNNSLSGSIPSLPAGLTWLLLPKNKLSGTLPSFASLTSLTLPDHLDLGYNALTSAASGEDTLVLSKQSNWKDTQTVAPTGLRATALSSSQVQVNWTPITYTADGGYYQVKYATTPGGPYTNASSPTTDKTVSSYTVTGLTPGTAYYFVVESFTPAHGYQQNNLTSVLLAGQETAITTIPASCGITVTGGSSSSGHATYNPAKGEVYIPFIDVPGAFGGIQTYEVYLVQQPSSTFTFDLDLGRVVLK